MRLAAFVLALAVPAAAFGSDYGAPCSPSAAADAFWDAAGAIPHSKYVGDAARQCFILSVACRQAVRGAYQCETASASGYWKAVELLCVAQRGAPAERACRSTVRGWLNSALAAARQDLLAATTYCAAEAAECSAGGGGY